MSIFDWKKSTKKPRFIGHRGFTPLAPENSLPAFRYAGLFGHWAIETDVHLSKDGVLVCCHNFNVQAMYGQEGLICQMTKKELLNLRIHAGNRLECFSDEDLTMPLFLDYLKICRRYQSIPFIELKTEDVSWVLKELKKAGFEENEVVMSASHLPWLVAARKSAPKIFIHHIFSDEKSIEELAILGNGGLSLKIENPMECDEEDIRKIHGMGLKVCLRAADSIQAVQKMMALELDYLPTNKMHL